GKTDTASGLRGCCAMGLVRMNYPEVMAELADLLADPESPARIAAARAIAYCGSSQGVPLLRLKVRTGDKDPQVLAECFAGLLQLAPAQSLALIAQFLAQPDEAIAEMAALALGESRVPEAFPVLHHCWQHTRYDNLKRTALLAIAMLRQDEALQFLLSLVAQGKPDEAQEAIAVLGIYKQDTVLWQQVCDAAQKRGDIAAQSNSD
ncbi:MAG: HEAT repeat domain-containing protein, partial [Thermosynechococcaceae cyanobacterium]